MRTQVELMRQAVRELACETKLKVVDNLDDQTWIQILAGPYNTAKDHQTWVKLTIDVEGDGVVDDDGQLERLKDELRQRIQRLRNYSA